MALNGNQMGSEVAAYILGQAGAPLNASEQAIVVSFWQGICTAIVNHITTNGHAIPGTFLDSMGSPISGKGDLE
jgi:hypothetical protein